MYYSPAREELHEYESATHTHMSIARFSTKPWWRGIAPGDTVHFSTQHGNPGKGRVVMSLPTHVVLNIGGRHGTPKLVDENNYMSHKSMPTPKPRKKKS